MRHGAFETFNPSAKKFLWENITVNEVIFLPVSLFSLHT